MNRREFVGVTMAGMATLMGCQTVVPAGNGKRPNILFILADDLGYGDVGCYGADPKHMRTPNIDRLAKEGLRFSDGHAPSSVCTPTRYALLTGEYAFRNKKGAGIIDGDASLAIRQGSYTLPAMLQKNGYATGFVGKWHLGLAEGKESIQWNGEIKPGPLEIGFDEAFFMPSTGDRVPTVLIRNHNVENLDPKDPITINYQHKIGNEPTGHDNIELATVLKGLPKAGHLDAITEGVTRIGYMTGGKAALWKDERLSDTLAGEACKFIESHQNKPFFLYFSTHGIHEPRIPSPRFRGKSGAGVYGDQTEEMDDAVGQVLKALDRMNLADNTLVIFSSDNGATEWVGYDYGLTHADVHGHRINGDLRGEKGTVWEGGTRVPFIVRWPGHIPAGKDSPALISLIDLQASFARLQDVKLPDDAAPDSADVLDALLGKSRTGRHELVEHRYGHGVALRVDNWKFIDGQLYDLSTDLSETRNLAAEYPDRVKAMSARLKELVSSPKTR